MCEERGQTPRDLVPPPSQEPGWRESRIQEEVAAAQRTCLITEQGEQAKASMEQNQASSVASVQPCRRERRSGAALMLSEMRAAPQSHTKPGAAPAGPAASHAARDKGTRPASAETGPKLKQQEEAKLFSCFCFDQP